MNDTERELWVYNDETLYNSWINTKWSIKVFIKMKRKMIDEHICKAAGIHKGCRDENT